jgi:hypothetical protein
MSVLEDAKCHLQHSFAVAKVCEQPFRNYQLCDVLPPDVLAAAIGELRFPPQTTGETSGKRELHNDTRHYLDAETLVACPFARAIADAYQDGDTVALIERMTGADLGGCYLRIELAQDTDGFWLEPHTDLGVKKFTLFHYVSAETDDLGTDLYFDHDRWACRFPFAANTALVFIPAPNTFHGFERRPITGVRRSLIVNFVTEDWRAREQLAFPDRPVVEKQRRPAHALA